MSDLEEWFLRSGFRAGVSSILLNSSEDAFIDAEEYYQDLRREVEQAGRGHWICWLGFDGGSDVPMPVNASPPKKKVYPPRQRLPSDVSWFELLKKAGERGASIRVLLNLHPSPKPPDRYLGANFILVNKLNAEIRSCGAINDFRYLWLNGTNHQKLVIVYHDGGLIAYCGTMDIHENRINDSWCELQCKFKGEAAEALFSIFLQRWREQTNALTRLGSEKSYLPLLPQRSRRTTTSKLLVQVGTTYGNPQRNNPLGNFGPDPKNILLKQSVNMPHRVWIELSSFLPIPPPAPIIISNNFFHPLITRSGFSTQPTGSVQATPTQENPLEKFLQATPKQAKPLEKLHVEDSEKQAPIYSFAPYGHNGIYHQIKHAIEKTREFIYMEDQYLVCDQPMGRLEPMSTLLARKLRESNFKKLIILCTRIDEINSEFQFTAWAHRQHFINELVSAGGSKVVICQYKSRASLGISIPADKPWLAHESPFYVHSKTWIFDDLFMICGSANCNRRGYSHDSELDFSVYDPHNKFVRNVRIRLWEKRLNTQNIDEPIKTTELENFLVAAQYWEDPDKFKLAIENNRPNLDKLRPIFNVDKTEEKTITDFLASYLPSNRTHAISSLVSKIKAIGLWNIVVDPDGT